MKITLTRGNVLDAKADALVVGVKRLASVPLCGGWRLDLASALATTFQAASACAEHDTTLEVCCFGEEEHAEAMRIARAAGIQGV